MIVLFVIITFVQCVATMDKNELFTRKEMMQSVADTSDILKYLDKMGIDSSEFLNNFETEYFNTRFKDYHQNFDFTGKKICFLGPGGLVFSDKQKYFSSLKKTNFVVQSDLYIFNADQKGEVGGYDVAIVYWSKRRYLSKDVVKRLKKKQ